LSVEIITHLGTVDPVMKRLVAAAGPLAIESRDDHSPYEVLARAIAHQQLNGKAAQSILNRFVSTCGQGIFPTPAALLALEDAALRASGFSFSKIAALRDLAAKTMSGVVPVRDVLHALSDLEIIERLTAVRGIGRWTVQMLLMLGLYGARWAPYRSAAAWYLWRAVDLSRAGQLPPCLEAVQLPRLPRKRRKAARKPPRRLKRVAVCAAPRAPAGVRTRARRPPARRSRAPKKKK
jgi:DNA-3-methyladenine glycosylase II